MQTAGFGISHITLLLPQLSTLMYMERLEDEGSCNPLVYSTSDPPDISYSRTFLSVPYPCPSQLRPPSPHLPSPLFGLISPSPPPQRNQFRLLLHTVMACWPREMEFFQVLGYNLSTPPLPPHAASQHFLNTGCVPTGKPDTTSNHLVERFCTLCDWLNRDTSNYHLTY